MTTSLIVLTIVKNPGDLIKNSLVSLYEQRNINFTHYILDGGSTDNWDVGIDWDFYKSSIVIEEHDEGIYDGLNKATRYVPEDAIFTYLHAGDVITQDTYLRDCFDIFEADETLDLLYSDVQFHNEKNNVVRIFKSGDYMTSKLKYGWAPAHTSLVMRKRFFNKVGEHDTSFQISGDYDWMLRAFSMDPTVFYYKNCAISMLAGGISTAGLKSFRVKLVEDCKAAKSLPLRGLPTVLGKRIRKLGQIRVNGIK